MVTWRTTPGSNNGADAVDPSQSAATLMTERVERLRSDVCTLIAAIRDRRVSRKQLLALVEELKTGRVS